MRTVFASIFSLSGLIIVRIFNWVWSSSGSVRKEGEDSYVMKVIWWWWRRKKQGGGLGLYACPGLPHEILKTRLTETASRIFLIYCRSFQFILDLRQRAMNVNLVLSNLFIFYFIKNNIILKNIFLQKKKYTDFD